MEIITVLVFLMFFPTSQERFCWIIIAGVTLLFPHSDDNDGFRLKLPYATDEDLTSLLQSIPTLKYLLLGYAAVLVYYCFASYTVRGGGLLFKVEKLVTHFSMMCDDKPSVSAGKFMRYIILLKSNISFFG